MATKAAAMAQPTLTTITLEFDKAFLRDSGDGIRCFARQRDRLAGRLHARSVRGSFACRLRGGRRLGWLGAVQDGERLVDSCD